MSHNSRKLVVGSVFLAVLMSAGLGYATETKTEAAAGASADWKFHTIVDVAFLQQYAKLPLSEDVMIIDSRPYKPKYVNGHIPTAVNIPDSQFEKMTGKLPENKNALLIFYCGGPT